MSPSTRRILLGLWITCLSLSGCMPARVQCGVDEDCARGEVCDAELQCVSALGDKCDADADCQGSYCVRGACSASAACVLDQDCAVGYICEAHVCVGVECTEDSACTPKICSRGRCTNGCVNDGECAVGLVCEGGACDPVCTVDQACGAGKVCREGRCQAECDAAADCADGWSCLSGRCVDAECTADAGCATDERCEDYRCVDSTPCTEASACAAGERCLRGYCRVPECEDNTACTDGYSCQDWSCRIDPPPSRAFEVAEEASLMISLPAGASVNDPGGAGAASAEGGIRYRPSRCSAGQDILHSHLRMADGSVQLMTSTVSVVDPGAPERTQLRLSDVPALRQVTAEFSLPAENPGGSRCRPVRYEFEWDDGTGSTQTQGGRIADQQLGDTLSERLAVLRGERADILLRVFDEEDQASESRAALAITRAEVQSFSFSANDRVPTDNVEVNWTVLRASRVQILRDGAVEFESPSGSGSHAFPVGGRASVFVLRYFDAAGNAFDHPSSLQLRINGRVEVEPNNSTGQANEMEAQGAGYAQPGNVDIWRVSNAQAGGHLEISTLSIGGSCISRVRVAILDASGAELASSSGLCPSVRAEDLASGAHYVRVSAVDSAADYVLSASNDAPRCGNGIVETRAGEQCDGWTLCNSSCQTTLSVDSSTEEFPESQDINVGNARMRVVMSQPGWIDVGTGNYQINSCATPSRVTLSDASFQPLTGGEARAPDGCGRIVRAVGPGTYYVTVSAGGASGTVRLNYAAHVQGRCGDGVVDPTVGEQCDPPSTGGVSGEGLRSCDNSCRRIQIGYEQRTERGNGQFVWGVFDSNMPMSVACVNGPDYQNIELEVYDMTNHFMYRGLVWCDRAESIVQIQSPTGFVLANQAWMSRFLGDLEVTPVQ